MKWISVEDELPDKIEGLPRSRAVLVHCPENICSFTATYDHEGHRWEHFGRFGLLNYGVTHWMPLPEPPEEK